MRTWIISPFQDRAFILGGVGINILLTVGMLASGTVNLWWWIWIVALDGPHIFATLARTYLDPEEWKIRKTLLLGSLVWLLVGPATLALSAILHTQLPTVIFMTLASLWAYWHVLRQHLGFMALYKRAAGENDSGDDTADRAALYVGTIAPFLAFALGHPEARPMLGLTGPMTWEPTVQGIFWGAAVLVILGWGARMAQAMRAGRPVSRSKITYLLLLFGWTAVLFSPPIANRLPLAGITVAVTAWHNLQYHALIWFYKKNRYKEHQGSFLLYAVAGVLFTLSYRLPGCYLGSTPGCTTNPAPIIAGMPMATVASAIFWGVALHHYFLDQYIWRPSQDVRLRRELGIPQ